MSLRWTVPLTTVALLPLPVWAQSATVMTFPAVSAASAASVPMFPTSPNLLSASLVEAPAINAGEIFPTSARSCLADAPPPRRLLPRISASRYALWPVIALAACRHNLPAGLLDGVILAESGYRSKAVSRVGAAGLMQIMPATAIELGLADRFDPVANVEAGALYLRQLLDRFRGDARLALAAYNAGPGAVAKASGVPVKGETPGYVNRVLGFWLEQTGSEQGSEPSARSLAVALGFAPANERYIRLR